MTTTPHNFLSSGISQSKEKYLGIINYSIVKSRTYSKLYNDSDLHAHLLDLLDEDGYGVGDSKLVVPSLGTTILVL